MGLWKADREAVRKKVFLYFAGDLQGTPVGLREYPLPSPRLLRGLGSRVWEEPQASFQISAATGEMLALSILVSLSNLL